MYKKSVYLQIEYCLHDWPSFFYFLTISWHTVSIWCVEMFLIFNGILLFERSYGSFLGSLIFLNYIFLWLAVNLREWRFWKVWTLNKRVWFHMFVCLCVLVHYLCPFIVIQLTLSCSQTVPYWITVVKNITQALYNSVFEHSSQHTFSSVPSCWQRKTTSL